MRKLKKDYPFQLTVHLAPGHPMGRKTVTEIRSFRFKTKLEAEKEESLLNQIGTVLSSRIL